MRKWLIVFKIILKFLLKPSSSYYSVVERTFVAELSKTPDDLYLLWFLSNHYVRYSKYDEAEFYLEKLVNNGEEKRELVLLLSKVYFKQHKYDNILNLLYGYEELHDDDIHNYYLGYSFLKLEKFKEAIVYFEKYVHLYTIDYIPFVKLGYAYYMEKKYDFALDAYRKAENLNPSQKEIKDSIDLCIEKISFH